MALTKKDLQLIKQVVEDVVDQKLEEKLNQKLKAFPTREEMQAMFANYATREEMQAMFANYATREEMHAMFANYADRDELDEKLASIRSDFYNKIDPFLIEIQDSRQARAIDEEKLSDHDDRITHIETVFTKELKLAV